MRTTSAAATGFSGRRAGSSMIATVSGDRRRAASGARATSRSVPAAVRTGSSSWSPVGSSSSIRRPGPDRFIRAGKDVPVHAETLLVLVLGAVALIVAAHWVAARTGLPEAALLTLAGIAYAVLPGPNVVLDPE